MMNDAQYIIKKDEFELSRSEVTWPKIAVIIPCYKVKAHILEVLDNIGPEVCAVYIVDDHCPEHTGEFVASSCTDPRIMVIRNEKNLGVGGAVMAGYKAALADGAEYLLKIDGDNQMNPALVPVFIAPLISGDADYVKGNRFSNPESLIRMPKIRLLGNAVLSFLTKLSCGYWNIFDPTNGYTAMHACVAEQLPFHKISQGYFFETDMLFRLNSLNAVVVDIPLTAVYENEQSSMRILRVIPEFLAKHMRNFFKRIIYRYFIKDFSLASVELLLGCGLFGFGMIYGIYRWSESAMAHVPAPPGAVMLAALPVLLGVQLLLAFFNYDIISVPKTPLHPSIIRWRKIENSLRNKVL